LNVVRYSVPEVTVAYIGRPEFESSQFIVKTAHNNTVTCACFD